MGFYFQWEKDPKEAVGRPLTWWRTTFEKPAGDDPLVLDLSGMTKGMAWLNGKCIGRYWLVPAHEQKTWPNDTPVELHGLLKPTQRFYNLPFEWLEKKENTLVLFEEIGGDPSTIRICRKTWTDSCNKGITGKGI